MNSLALMFTLGLILISHSPLAVNAKGQYGLGLDMRIQVCRQSMPDIINCMSILRSDPKILNAENYLELSQAILELALKKGIEGQNFLKELVQINDVPAIKECANLHYDGVIGSFRSALKELKEDPDTANSDAKVAGDGPDACDRALASAHIVNPDIAALNRQIKLLSNTAFQAINKLP
ncbi:hypothetical protein VNO77_12757 [Canavalia gladiata]|uniref:Pectinesterase inhibitor domain-containing protein n=1 Tax=Canavalia gladiata TaxID=3824 RepID=A0AAN9M1W9_CANGL